MTNSQKGTNQMLWMVLLGVAGFAGSLLVIYFLFILLSSLGFLGA